MVIIEIRLQEAETGMKVEEKTMYVSILRGMTMKKEEGKVW